MKTINSFSNILTVLVLLGASVAIIQSAPAEVRSHIYREIRNNFYHNCAKGACYSGHTNEQN